MQTPPWYVLTGAPSSGKTTVLERLAQHGYHTIPDAGRIIIEEHLRKGISLQELMADSEPFAKKSFRRRLEMEASAPKDRTVFFDRGIPDSVAYYKLWGLNIREVEGIGRGRYRKAFFFEQLPLQQEGVRTEDAETARILNDSLLWVYSNLGYEIVNVPAISVEERVQLILSNL